MKRIHCLIFYQTNKQVITLQIFASVRSLLQFGRPGKLLYYNLLTIPIKTITLHPEPFPDPLFPKEQYSFKHFLHLFCIIKLVD